MVEKANQKDMEKKVKVTVEYFDKESGEDKTFSEESNMASVICINRTEDGNETSIATIGSGNPVDIATGAARMVSELILQVNNPRVKVLMLAAYIERFADLVKKGDPVLGMMIPVALNLTDSDDEEEESEGEEE